MYFGVLIYSSVYGLHVPVLLASSSRFWTVFLSETWTPKISSRSFSWHFVRAKVDAIFLPNIHWCRVKLHVQHNDNLAGTAAELLNWTILQYLSLTHLTSTWFSKFCIWCVQSVVWAWSWLHILLFYLTLRLLMSYIYGAPSKARNANVVYIWTYVWQRWNSLFLFAAQCFNTESMQRGFLFHICV